LRPPPLRADAALFLDVDGTLLELTNDPAATRADAPILALLSAVAERLQGALALVSGRSIARLDELFAPLRLPAAGQHGIERRGADGRRYGGEPTDMRLEAARLELEALTRTLPGLKVEDKGRSLALHFRENPQWQDAAQAAASSLVSRLGPEYHVQPGSMVFEIKARGHTKGTAIAAFCAEPPFQGRAPVCVGDDLTDLDGFRWTDAHGGLSVAVGDRVQAHYHLEDPQAVRDWLQALVAGEAASARQRV
jgi:trehalose 6-phosphate phosphatase